MAIDTARLLAARGFRVIFFAAVGPVCPSLEAAGIDVRCLGQSDILSNKSRTGAMLSGLWNREAAKALTEVIKGLDPRTSVLHCHGYAKALSPAIGPVLADAPVASLFTMHEYFLACPNGGFYDFRRQEICTRRPLGSSCIATNCDARSATHKAWRVARQALTWGPGRMPRGLRHLAYLSEIQLGAMKPYLPATATLHHLPNPVASASGERLADPNLASDFIFVGRLSPEKGPRVFAEAARMAGVHAVFVGEGAERDAILRVNPDADITGWKSPEVVEQLMLGARALVFPSLWYETFGLVAYEAIARGLPVVAGRQNAASEAIRPDRNGIILDRMEPEGLARILRDLLRQDHPIFSEIRKPENREAPSEDDYLSNLLDIYHQAMSDRQGHPSNA